MIYCTITWCFQALQRTGRPSVEYFAQIGELVAGGNPPLSGSLRARSALRDKMAIMPNVANSNVVLKPEPYSKMEGGDGIPEMKVDTK